MDLADDRCIGAAGACGDGRPHSRQAGANHQDIVLQHRLFPFS
jgi:hypothetical protein